jgi:hypothetical protein
MLSCIHQAINLRNFCIYLVDLFELRSFIIYAFHQILFGENDDDDHDSDDV